MVKTVTLSKWMMNKERDVDLFSGFNVYFWFCQLIMELNVKKYLFLKL